MEELTTREYKLIYDAVQRHIDRVEEGLSYLSDKKYLDKATEIVGELEVILDKIGEKTIGW